jgi:ParB-like chromosome segregation protein Spo0J
VHRERPAGRHPAERAGGGYQRLVDAGVSAEDLAAKVGKSVSWIRDTLRLGRLPAAAQDAVDAGLLGPSVAALVARLPAEVARERVAACVLAGRDRDSIDRRSCSATSRSSGRSTSPGSAPRTAT